MPVFCRLAADVCGCCAETVELSSWMLVPKQSGVEQWVSAGANSEAVPVGARYVLWVPDSCHQVSNLMSWVMHRAF